MKLSQCLWTPEEGWSDRSESGPARAQLVLAFGGRSVLSDPTRLNELRELAPEAHVIGCSTAGEICGQHVLDDSLVATAVEFERSDVAVQRIRLSDCKDSLDAGERLAASMDPLGLSHLFVLSDGLGVNGSELVRGISRCLPEGVVVTGGLSGDADRFEKTLVLADGVAETDTVAAVGIYGKDLRVGYASLGGWDPFGPERVVTRSDHNVLYELDGQSALELYKEYLGDYAADLPASGLLFPLAVRTEGSEQPIVRTILGVDEEHKSMTFAGDMPEGAVARLMRANFDRLVDGAAGAAETSRHALGGTSPDLAILISCVGRKMVLKQRIEEEVEAVRGIVGDHTVVTGFYSYGEISPFTPNARCELHNQTMTITAFSEPK